MRTMSERLKVRLKRDRAMTMMSLRVPEDVIEDLKEVAPTLGFSGYQPLMRAYIGEGLRRDLARMIDVQSVSAVERLTESLRRQGIAEQVIDAALAESQVKQA